MVYEGMNAEFYTGMKVPYYHPQADLSPPKPQFQSGMPAAVTVLGQDALSHCNRLVSLPAQSATSCSLCISTDA